MRGPAGVGRRARVPWRRTSRSAPATPAALKLYDALGYVTHHPYNYRAPTA